MDREEQTLELGLKYFKVPFHCKCLAHTRRERVLRRPLREGIRCPSILGLLLRDTGNGGCKTFKDPSKPMSRSLAVSF